jgi:Protein of unknown function with HXXEE motif
MSFLALSWLFVLAVALHNLEEALLLPAWSQTAGRWHYAVGAPEFRFAVAILTAAAIATAGMASIGGKGSVGAYLVSGYALAMLLNVLFPHVLATILLRQYAPGTLTALLLNLPACALLLDRALREQYIQTSVFVWVGPVIVLALAASIPLLFALGRRLPLVVSSGPESSRNAAPERPSQ